jgi:hypothetical protein
VGAWCIKQKPSDYRWRVVRVVHHKTTDGASPPVLVRALGGGQLAPKVAASRLFYSDSCGTVCGRRTSSARVARILARGARCLSKICPSYILAQNGSGSHGRTNLGRPDRSCDPGICVAKSTRAGRLAAVRFHSGSVFHGHRAHLPIVTPFQSGAADLPAMLLIRDWKSLPRFSRLVFIVSVSWPSIVSWVLLLFRPRLDSPNQLPLLPSFPVSFVPLFLPLLLITRRSEIAMPPRRATVLRAS